MSQLERAVEPVTGVVVDGDVDVREVRVLPSRWVGWARLPMEEVGSDVEFGAEERRVAVCRVPRVEYESCERFRLLIEDVRLEARRDAVHSMHRVDAQPTLIAECAWTQAARRRRRWCSHQDHSGHDGGATADEPRDDLSHDCLLHSWDPGHMPRTSFLVGSIVGERLSRRVSADSHFAFAE